MVSGNYFKHASNYTSLHKKIYTPPPFCFWAKVQRKGQHGCNVIVIAIVFFLLDKGHGVKKIQKECLFLLWWNNCVWEIIFYFPRSKVEANVTGLKIPYHLKSLTTRNTCTISTLHNLLPRWKVIVHSYEHNKMSVCESQTPLATTKSKIGYF